MSDHNYVMFIPIAIMLAYGVLVSLFRSGRGGRIGAWWRDDDRKWCDQAIRNKEAELEQLRKVRRAMEEEQ